MRGLREIHHAGDAMDGCMDGHMDACLGYAAVMGAEIYKLIGELKDDLVEEQKKRALDGWDRMNIKRELEDALEDSRKEILDLKARVSYLESLVLKLVNPPHDPSSFLPLVHHLLFVWTLLFWISVFLLLRRFLA